MRFEGKEAMATDSSSGNSFKTWILGILGAVITAVLIFWLEQWITKPPTPPQPVHTIVSLNGRVIDRAANLLLQNAMVRLHVESLQEEQSTDSEGRYAFSLEDFDPRISGSMQIEAAGYKPLSVNSSLQEMSSMQDQLLDPLNPVHPADGNTPAHPIAARPVGAPVGKYLVRPDIKRVSALTKRP